MLKKKWVTMSLAAMASTMFFFSVCSAHADDVTTLVYSNYYPKTHEVAQKVHAPVLRKISEMTNGKIQFKEYWAGSLHALPDGFKAAHSGMSDLTQAYPLTKPGSFDLLHCDGLPFAFSNAVVAARCMEELYPKYFKKNYEQQGVNLAMYPVLEYTGIFTKKPVRSLDDLKGMKLQVPGGMMQEVYKKLGVIPVYINPAEMYTALQRGVVEGIVTLAGLFMSQRYNELCPYFTKLTICHGAIPFALNPKVMKKLDKETQKSLYNALQFNGVYMSKLYCDMDDKGFEDMKAYGTTIIELDAKEKARWTKAVEDVWKDFEAKYAAKNLPAKELLADLKKLNAKYSAMSREEVVEYAKQHPISGLISGF